MLSNFPHEPIDFFTHEICDQGEPKWLYLDPGIFQPPEGTTHLAVDFGEGEYGTPFAQRSLTEVACYTEPRDVVDFHGYFRLEHWPKNVFRSWSDLGPTRIDPDAEDAEKTDTVNDLYYYQTEFAYGGESEDNFDAKVAWAELEVFVPNIEFVVPHLRGTRPLEVVDNDKHYPDAFTRVRRNLQDGVSTIPRWLWLESSEANDHYTGDSLTLYITQDETFVYEGLPEHTDVADEPYRAIYYRRSGWPDSVMRLVESYELVGGRPKLESIFRTGNVGDWGDVCVPPRLGLDHIRNSDLFRAKDLNYTVANTRRRDVSYHQDPWFHCNYHEQWGTIHVIRNADTSDLHICLEAEALTRRVGDVYQPAGQGIPDGSKVLISAYRHPRWAQNIWSNRWNADGTPEYGPDAMGVGCPAEEDSTTPESPLETIEEFNYQTWVKLSVWLPGADDHSRVSHRFVRRIGESGVIGSSTVRANIHPAGTWTNSEHEWEAAYYRLRHFPEGVYRRIDEFKFDAQSTSIKRLPHEDSPSASEIGAPWHSGYLKQWVEAMESEIGRPIYPSPELGSPWIRFLDPEDTATDARLSSFTEGGMTFETSRLKNPPLPASVSATTPLVSHLKFSDGNVTVANRYRTGIDFRIDPCSIRYQGPQDDGAPKEPLWTVLSHIEEFIREYQDPNVINDVADHLYQKVTQEKNKIIPRLKDKHREIEDLRVRMKRRFEELHELQLKHDSHQNMSKGKYRSILRRHYNLLEMFGELSQAGTTIVYKMYRFEIEGQEIGPLVLKMQMNDQFGLTAALDPSGEANRSHKGHAHPHIDQQGHICFGTGRDDAIKMQAGTNPLEFLFLTAELLRDGYYSGDSYCKIRDWHPIPQWFCEDCDDDHRLGDNGEEICPNTCASCEQWVNWGRHGRCEEHNRCWSCEDRESCPVCNGEEEASDTASAAE